MSSMDDARTAEVDNDAKALPLVGHVLGSGGAHFESMGGLLSMVADGSAHAGSRVRVVGSGRLELAHVVRAVAAESSEEFLVPHDNDTVSLLALVDAAGLRLGQYLAAKIETVEETWTTLRAALEAASSGVAGPIQEPPATGWPAISNAQRVLDGGSTRAADTQAA